MDIHELTPSQSEPRTYLIAGLGNPGREYRNNRHNIGFMLVDSLGERLGLSFGRVQSQALVADGRYLGHKVILAKPRTFMNDSGRSVGPLARYYRIPLAQTLVVYDELDLPAGSLRLRSAGGSGGHNGMRSVIDHLGSEGFPRLRLGIGRPPGRMEPANYVLQDFSPAEEPLRVDLLARGVAAVLTFIEEGIDLAMTRHNPENGQAA
jgi:PTH1 family peptidyl-tRNA hydrolase